MERYIGSLQYMIIPSARLSYRADLQMIPVHSTGSERAHEVEPHAYCPCASLPLPLSFLGATRENGAMYANVLIEVCVAITFATIVLTTRNRARNSAAGIIYLLRYHTVRTSFSLIYKLF